MQTTPTHPHDSAGHDSAGHDSAGHDSAGHFVDWTNVCDLDRLEPLWAEAALIDGVQVALVLLPDGRLFAVSNRDPATGSFVMSRGIVGSRGDRPTLASPLHKQVYDLETGECFTSADYTLRIFPVRVDHGTVQIQIRGGAYSLADDQIVAVEFAAA